MRKDSNTDYGSVSKILHWLVAIIIMSLIVAGFYMTNIPDSNTKWQIYGVHKAIGISVLIIAITRIAWRLCHTKPSLPVEYAKWQKIIAASMHGILYLITIIMPLSGWIMSIAANHVPSWFGLFELRLPIAPSKPLAKVASSAHEIIAWVLLACLFIHIGAALKDKKILSRMLPKRHNN